MLWPGLKSMRLAITSHAGRKAFTLQTIPAPEDGKEDGRLAKASGFSLHAGVATQAHQRRKLERLCRYIARPAVSTERMALTSQGNVRYTLKTLYRDGTTHIILEPLDFIARLTALVPKPRVNLTRFHGVFAPNSALRQQVTRAGRDRQNNEPKTSAQRHAAMTWDQRLKRVFKIDIESCEQCGGATLIYQGPQSRPVQRPPGNEPCGTLRRCLSIDSV